MREKEKERAVAQQHPESKENLLILRKTSRGKKQTALGFTHEQFSSMI